MLFTLRSLLQEVPLPTGHVNMNFDGTSEISGEFGETIGPPSISKRVSISNEPVNLFWSSKYFQNVYSSISLFIFFFFFLILNFLVFSQTVQTIDLPPDDEIELTLKDRLTLFSSCHMKALIWKNFLWMWRNVA